jgi:recombinase-like zinc beta ribbon protein/recombinase
VRKIYWWYGVENLELTEIRRRLVENRVAQKGHSGQIKMPWHKNVLYGMLKGTHYYGEVTVHAAGQTWKVDCPAIIEKWVWDKVQERIKASKSYPMRHYTEAHLMAGLLYCAACGHIMHARTSYYRLKSGVEHVRRRLYHCTVAWQYPDVYNCKRHFGAKKLEAEVWDLLSHALEHPEIIKQQLEEKANRLKLESLDIEERIERLAARVKEIQEERQWLIVQARKKVITDAEFENQMNLLAEQKSAVDFELQELQQATTQRDEAERIIAFANEFFADLRGAMNYLNQPTKGLSDQEQRKIAEEERRILKMLVTRIDLDQEGNLKVAGVLDKKIVTAQIKSPIH